MGKLKLCLVVLVNTGEFPHILMLTHESIDRTFLYQVLRSTVIVINIFFKNEKCQVSLAHSQ